MHLYTDSECESQGIHPATTSIQTNTYKYCHNYALSTVSVMTFYSENCLHIVSSCTQTDTRYPTTLQTYRYNAGVLQTVTVMMIFQYSLHLCSYMSQGTIHTVILYTSNAPCITDTGGAHEIESILNVADKNTYTDLVYQIHPCFLMKDNSWNQQDTEWTYDLGTIIIQPFECFVGPKSFIADNPLEIFQLFFSNEMLDGIVDASNEYAKVTMPAEKFCKWE